MDNNLINIFISRISNICDNDIIINYIKKLININKDYIFEFDDNNLRARRFDEVLEINITGDSFAVYSTEWGATNRRRIVFMRVDNRILISLDDNEVMHDGSIKRNYIYEYFNSKLSHYKYTESVNFEYNIKNELRKINNNKDVDIIPFDGVKAIKKSCKNGVNDYSIVELKYMDYECFNMFYSLYYKNNYDISLNEYEEKIKELK